MSLLSSLIAAQLPVQEFRRNRPGEPGQPRIVTVAIAESEAVTCVLKEMPIQRLPVSVEAGLQAILHGNAGYMIIAAKKDERWALEIFYRIVGMTRA